MGDLQRLQAVCKCAQINEVFFGGDKTAGPGAGFQALEAFDVAFRVAVMIGKKNSFGQFHAELTQASKKLTGTRNPAKGNRALARLVEPQLTSNAPNRFRLTRSSFSFRYHGISPVQ